MATALINSDEKLRKFLPNAFATAKGEPSFYTKVTPWLELAEQWLFNSFIGGEFKNTLLAMNDTVPLKLTAACVVAHEAMLRAVPSLDLVLTPNGFGIVSNQNVAPASRERVERLMASLEACRDNAIEQMILFLFREADWYNSSIRHWFTATLFPNINLANLCGFTEHRWLKYVELRQRAIEVECHIANDFISPEQLEVFHGELMAIDYNFSMYSAQHANIIQRLQTAVVQMLMGDKPPVKSLRDIVDFMRKNEENFLPFIQSDTFKLYEQPDFFVNKKESYGYFF